MTLQEHMRSAAQTTSDAMSELLIGGADRIAALEAALAERDKVIEAMKVEMREMKSSYDIMGLAEEQRQRPGPFGGPGTPNALLRDIEEARRG